MSKQTRRELGLAVFAALNLAVWAAVALVIALVASDRVDLGIESMLRRVQGTTVALLPRMDPSSRRPMAGPTLAPSDSGSGVASGPTVSLVRATGQGEASLPSSLATAGVDGSGHSLPLAPGKDSGTSPSVAPTATSASGVSNSLAQPTPPVGILISQPLILANPPFTDLQNLDAEMLRSAAGRPVQIRYQEDALNHEIESLLQSNPDLPYEGVRVDLKRGELVLTGSLSVLGLDVKTQVQATLTAKQCLPQIDVQSVTVGGLLTPNFVKDTVRSEINKAMSWYPADYPLCLEEIVVEEDRATVYGTRR